MKTIFKNITRILIIVAVIFATVYIKGKYFPEKGNIKIDTIETVRDTVFQDSIIYKQLSEPEPDTIKETDTVKIPPDTVIKERYADIYNKYNSKYVYKDTLKDDTNALIVVDDVISRNRFMKRGLYYANRNPTQITQKKVIKKTTKTTSLYIGSEFGVKTLQFDLMYKNRNNFQYKVGYDIAKPKGVRFGIYTSFENIKGIFF